MDQKLKNSKKYPYVPFKKYLKHGKVLNELIHFWVTNTSNV